MATSRVILAVCCFFVGEYVRAHEHNSPLLGHPLDRCAQSTVTPISCAEVTTMDGLLPHPDDCRLFYYCVQPYLPPVCRQCPAGLHFNPVLYVCDWPEQAGCTLSPVSSERCRQRSVTPVSCAEVRTMDGLVPHPDDCNLFYYCVQPYLPPICRQCPADLHFNPNLYVCDWPSRAGCGASNPTTEAMLTTAWGSDNDTSTYTTQELETNTTESWVTESETTSEAASVDTTTTDYPTTSEYTST